MKKAFLDVEEGVVFRPTFAFFATYCREWLEWMQTYRERVPDDWWPFWYGERPLVGFLSAAIWGADDACIEEFRSEKKTRGTTRRRRTYPGRGDLYFTHRRPRGADLEGNVEFKLHDIGIARTHHHDRFLERSHRIGEADASTPQDGTIPRYYGMLLRPYIGLGRDAQDTDRYKDNLGQLLREVWKTLAPDALAWWCPLEAVMRNDRKTKNLLVGVILVLKGIGTRKAKA